VGAWAGGSVGDTACARALLEEGADIPGLGSGQRAGPRTQPSHQRSAWSTCALIPSLWVRSQNLSACLSWRCLKSTYSSLKIFTEVTTVLLRQLWSSGLEMVLGVQESATW